MTTDRTRRAHGHPLLRGFPLTVMSIATFAVIFALLMARVSRDPLLDARAAGAGAGIVRGSTAALTRTRTSGTVEAPAAAAGSAATAPVRAVVARTSGGGAAGAESDDG